MSVHTCAGQHIGGRSLKAIAITSDWSESESTWSFVWVSRLGPSGKRVGWGSFVRSADIFVPVRSRTGSVESSCGFRSGVHGVLRKLINEVNESSGSYMRSTAAAMSSQRRFNVEFWPWRVIVCELFVANAKAKTRGDIFSWIMSCAGSAS